MAIAARQFGGAEVGFLAVFRDEPFIKNLAGTPTFVFPKWQFLRILKGMMDVAPNCLARLGNVAKYRVCP